MRTIACITFVVLALVASAGCDLEMDPMRRLPTPMPKSSAISSRPGPIRLVPKLIAKIHVGVPRH